MAAAGYMNLGDYSQVERDLFLRFEATLEDAGFTYLSVPSFISRGTVERQEVVAWEHVLKVSDTLGLAGSAEQGILEYFADTRVAEGRYWAHNQCFRGEDEVIPWARLREFRKTELFSFTNDVEWNVEFLHLLKTATSFLEDLGLVYRLVDKTGDPGYHKKKTDVEVWTYSYGWIETHSCTYFGEEQTRRFGITGATHTVSNTGLASPRILIPLVEDSTPDSGPGPRTVAKVWA